MPSPSPFNPADLEACSQGIYPNISGQLRRAGVRSDKLEGSVI